MNLPLSLVTLRSQYPTRSISVHEKVWQIRDTAFNEIATDVPPLILLPGALGTGDVFHHLLTGLGKNQRLISVSFPPLPDARALADGLVQLMDILELSVIDLLGTSLGGYVAQIVALHHRQRIRKLILANTFYDPGLQQARWPPAKQFAQRSSDEVLAAARLQLENGPTPTSAHLELKRLMLEFVGTEQSGDHVKAMRLAVLTAEPLAQVMGNEADLTLIDDEFDPVIAAETRMQMRHRYAGSRLFKIADGGHFPAILQPRAYQDAIVAALGF
jgi:pimeloyl-ACP methyl ester carboxylesterase